MKMIYSKSQEPVIYETNKIIGTDPREHDIYDRHNLLKRFNQAALSRAKVNLIGGGGLGSMVGIALIRKGIGKLTIYDGDSVDITNLARQHYFKEDLYRNKGISLAKNLSKLASGHSIIKGIPHMIQDAIKKGDCNESDIVIVGVDNNNARFFCSDFFYNVPVIFTAVSPEADSGYVFVQEPGKACFGCLFGDQFNRPLRKCVGSTIDINMVVSGIVSYVVDTLIMERERDWNYKRVNFHGPFLDSSKMEKRVPNCEYCKDKKF